MNLTCVVGQGVAGLGRVRFGVAWHGAVFKLRIGISFQTYLKAGHGPAWHGQVGRGLAWRGYVSRINFSNLIAAWQVLQGYGKAR